MDVDKKKLVSALNISSFDLLLDNCVKPSKDQLNYILTLADHLEQDRVGTVFLETFKSEDNVRTNLLLGKLVKVPDRTINILGLDQDSIPDTIYPEQFVGLLLRNVCFALISVAGAEYVNPRVVSSLLTRLLLTNREQLVRHAGQLISFLTVWTKTNISFCTLCQTIVDHLDTSTLEWVLMAALANTKSSSAMHRLLGECFVTPDRLSLLQHQLLVRGLPGGIEAVHRLVGYCRMAERGLLPTILHRAMDLWCDEVQVTQGDSEYQVGLAWLLCSLLANMTEDQLERERELVTRGLVRGMVWWLEGQTEKRELGMCVATVMLERFGGHVPEWEIVDKQLLGQLRDLASQVEEEEEEDVGGEPRALLEQWEVTDVGGRKFQTEVKMGANRVVIPVSVESDKQSTELLDSDDEDPDEFPAYDMSEDTEVTEESKISILYLRDVIDHLSDPETVHAVRCLTLLPSLAKRYLGHEDPFVTTELLKLVLYADNKQDLAEFAFKKKQAVVSVVLVQPVPASKVLVPAMFDKENTLNTKFLVMDSLVAAATEMSASSHPLLADFLSLTVVGLCVGGGGTWGSLRVQGLETSLLSHILLQVAGLVKLGLNFPGWEVMAADFSELLLAVSGCEKTSVKAAVLHGFSVVTALVPTNMLEGGRLASLLGEGARWAAGLRGKLGGPGEELAIMLSFKHQEAVKQQIKKDLGQKRETKMTIDKKVISLN